MQFMEVYFYSSRSASYRIFTKEYKSKIEMKRVHQTYWYSKNLFKKSETKLILLRFVSQVLMRSVSDLIRQKLVESKDDIWECVCWINATKLLLDKKFQLTLFDHYLVSGLAYVSRKVLITNVNRIIYNVNSLLLK